MKIRTIIAYSVVTYASILYHCWTFTWLAKGSDIVETTPGALIASLSMTVFAFLCAHCFSSVKDNY